LLLAEPSENRLWAKRTPSFGPLLQRRGGARADQPSEQLTWRDLIRRRIRPVIARRRTEHGSGLGRWRCVVERTFAWLHQFKRLLARYERRADMHEALLRLARCLICFRRLEASF
jgi:transposase